MRRPRAAEASCAICMDSLFDARDDLDEVMPITAPDCGHVFHEACLSNWFSTQANAYLARMRDQGVRFRGESPSMDDAPAECPQCRAECYADPETGQPILHRLFINFGEPESATQPSQTQSSPATQRWSRRETLDGTGMGIARRAKGVGAEIESLGATSTEDEVAGALRRVETLQTDAVALSAKTSTALKKYIGGMTVALNRLRTELETHPLITELRAEIAKLQEANSRQVAALMKMERVAIPAAVKKAVEAERSRAEKDIRVVEAQRDTMQRQLEKEQVARAAHKRAMAEREGEIERKLAAAMKDLQQEIDERAALQLQLTERTRLVKLYQAKSESRKILKTENEQLKAEIDKMRAVERLRAATSRPSQVSTPQQQPRPQPQRQGSGPKSPADDLDLEIDLSDAPPRKRPADESLVVEDLDLDGDDDLGLDDFDFAPRGVGRSRTARTFTFDVEAGRVRRDKDGEKARRRAREPEPVRRTSGSEVLGKRDAEQYAPPKSGRVDLDLDLDLNLDDLDFEHAARPRPVAKGKENAPSRSKYFPADGVLVAASSPPPSQDPGLGLSSPGSPKRRRVVGVPRPHGKVAPSPSPEVIDLVSSSPPQRPALRFGTSGTGSTARPAAPRPAPRPVGGTRSLVDFLGVADDRGRLRKGVALGSKVKKRF